MVNSEGPLFSPLKEAGKYEAEQIREYLSLEITKDDVVLHCDLSFPGLFHQALLLKKPGRAVAICHATSLNESDVWSDVWLKKWPFELASAALYDHVVVATKYHADKIGWGNVRVLGALPSPPDHILPEPSQWSRDDGERFVSVSRPGIQKTNKEVEDALFRMGHVVHRKQCDSWKDYFHFLDESNFMVITAREETYGYQVVDALSRGCIPIAPRHCSYPELLPSRCLYDPSKPPEEQAREIVSIAKKLEGDRVRLLCESKVRAFFQNLAKLLK